MTVGQARTRIAVIGLGNELMADDGVAIHAIRRLRDVLPEAVPCVEVGTAVLRAQTLCETTETLIAIDAVHADGPPGSVYTFDLTDEARSKSDSLHNLSLAGLLSMIPVEQRPRVVVVGVEPAVIDYALELSEPAEAALPDVVRAVSSIVERIHQENP